MRKFDAMPPLPCDGCEAGEVKVLGTPPHALHFCSCLQMAIIGTVAYGSIPRWRAVFPVGEAEVIAQANLLRSLAQEAKELRGPDGDRAH